MGSLDLGRIKLFFCFLPICLVSTFKNAWKSTRRCASKYLQEPVFPWSFRMLMHGLHRYEVGHKGCSHWSGTKHAYKLLGWALILLSRWEATGAYNGHLLGPLSTCSCPHTLLRRRLLCHRCHMGCFPNIDLKVFLNQGTIQHKDAPDHLPIKSLWTTTKVMFIRFKCFVRKSLLTYYVSETCGFIDL